MPSKKKKYNARFPAGRIKKIMQTDEEVGKVAQAVPVIISRTLELFVESLLTKTLRITNARNAKTLSPSHMKQCIISESRFDFLRDLVKNIPDIGVNEEQLSGSETGYEPAPSNGDETPGTSSSGLSLQRSESYTPASSSSSSAAVAVNYAGILPVKVSIPQPATPQQQPANILKRTNNHVGFYKEISLDETTGPGSSSTNREPPPKLTRLHSAPASATITTASAASAIPFKIDILPTLPAASQQRGVPATAPASSSNYKITYKYEPLKEAATPKATANPQPVFKLDYSNVKLPQTGQGTPPTSQQQQSRPHHPLQPTIKIDLSSITNFNHNNNNNQSSPVVVVKQQVPSAATNTTPSTPLSAASASSSSSSSSSGVSSGSSSRNPYVFSTGAASSSSASAAATYSSVVSSSSAIPGMDEDYDDI